MPEEPPQHIERRPVTLAQRVLQGGPVALVTARHAGHENVLPVAWHTPLSATPPLIGIAIEQSRYSVELISHGEEFAINIPPALLVHHVQYLGALSGEHIDKFEVTQLETFPALHITAPLLRDCVAWIECEVQQVLPVGDHLLYVGLPRAVRVDGRAFDQRWRADASRELRPLHYLGGESYAVLDEHIEARTPKPSEAPERVLQERVAEALELTREAQERREELMGQLRDEVAAGNVVDLSGSEQAELPELDLSLGIVVGDLPEGEPGQHQH